MSGQLSIPSTWDFSMNRCLIRLLSLVIGFPFNSLYLGFFHESLMYMGTVGMHAYLTFQFPLLGIFPWIWLLEVLSADQNFKLSIPSTWDFSMNRSDIVTVADITKTAFNSLYLGFFHESTTTIQASATLKKCSFNSLYLGFFHESSSLQQVDDD